MNQNLKDLYRRLSYKFNDERLITEALRHPSMMANMVSVDFPHIKSYQRLEFLGDSVIDLLVAERVFLLFPHALEGELTKLRSSLVNAKRLGYIAETKLDLGQFLFMSNGQESAGGRSDVYILSCALESLFGAIFLDSGAEYLKIKSTLDPILFSDMREYLANQDLLDPKERIQALGQEKFKITPTYEVTGVLPPQESPTFVVKLMMGKIALAHASGSSKKDAERNAARKALEETKNLTCNVPFALLRKRNILDEIEFTESSTPLVKSGGKPLGNLGRKGRR